METKIKPGLKVICSLIPNLTGTVKAYFPESGKIVLDYNGGTSVTHISTCKAVTTENK